MQPTLGRVHWGWRVFPLHNQSLTQTLADHRFLVTIILGGDSWTLIIIIWLNRKTFPTQTHTHTHLTQEARKKPPPSPDDVAARPRDKKHASIFVVINLFSKMTHLSFTLRPHMFFELRNSILTKCQVVWSSPNYSLG
jgi:hypothetical protein